MIFESEINETYLKLDDFFKLRLKTQLKNSGYKFQKFRHIHDMMTDEKYFITLFNDQPITFKDRADLVVRLCQYIDKELLDLESEFEYRESQKKTSQTWDDYKHYEFNEENAHKQNKLNQIKEKLMK